MTLHEITSALTSRYAVLFGAGISYAPPSALPTARATIEALIAGLPIDPHTREKLMASVSPDWDEGLGYFDCLRFEQILEAFERSVGRLPELLHRVVPSKPPNAYHFQLARLLSRGHPVLTTNFDTLLERACEASDVTYTILSDDAHYEAYARDPNAFANPIFKLHGTWDVDVQDPSRLTASFRTMRSEWVRSRAKWRVVSQIAGQVPLLVIGYSGMDDFDVLPALRFTEARQRLVWFDHEPRRNGEVWNLVDGAPPRSMFPARPRWFLGRMFGALRFAGRVKRLPEDVWAATGSTEELMASLAGSSTFSEAQGDATDAATHADGLATFATTVLKNPTPEVLLFAGYLSFDAGLYDSTLRLCAEALSEKTGTLSDVLCARVHCLAGQIHHDREEHHLARTHFAEAWERFVRLTKLPSSDIEDLLNASVELGVNVFQPPLLPALGALDQTNREAYSARLDRRLGALEADAAARRADYPGALRTSLSALKAKRDELEWEETADCRLQFLRIDRARNLHLARLGRREDGAWDTSDHNRYRTLIEEISETYELLQRRSKWAAAMLLEAEEDMWAVAPDWSADTARLARIIYSRIGNERGKDRCDALLRHLTAIERGAGAVSYRRDETRPHEIFEDLVVVDAPEVSFFCPSCRSTQRFSLRACAKCGLMVEYAPIPRSEEELGPEARLQSLFDAIRKRK